MRASASRAGFDVDADDHVRAGHSRALHDVQADAAESEHDDVRAGLDLRRIDHGADAGRHAAADVADLVERRVLADLRDGDLRQHGEVGEGRAAHVVMRAACRRARTGWCRRASAPCPASRGSPCRGSSCATGTTCTGGTRACRAESRGRPCARSSRPGPTSTTIPAPSWPRIAGKRPSGSAPERVNSSVWQIPVALISTSTSPAFGPASCTVSIVSGAPAL